MPLGLHEVFPDEDYRFHITLRKGDLGAFFAPGDDGLLAQRRRWLGSHPDDVAAHADGAEPLLTELEAMAPGLGLARSPGSSDGTIAGRLAALGASLEPDFMLLSRDEAGAFRLRAGVICFPSSWAIGEKIGRTLDDIHGIVPGLNPSLGATIGQFLGRLKPGAPFERANWGLAATPELNMHPKLNRPRLAAPVDASRVWVRIEDQILASMAGGGILFGIRIRVVALLDLMKDPGTAAGFLRALRTLPQDLAVYKGIAGIRGPLLRELGAG